LCFKRQYLKQNSVAQLKSTILTHPKFWAGHVTAHVSIWLLLYLGKIGLLVDKRRISSRFKTVARTFSIGGALRLCGGFDILKIDKTSTDLKCFMFQFGGLGALFGELSSSKPPPVATGLSRLWTKVE